MELPKFNETFLPILDVLKDGKIIKGRDLLRLVEEKYYSHLPEELLQQTTKSGDQLIENRIAWGKSYLKKGGLVHYPQRGFVQITEKGKSASAENVSLKNIQSNVITFYEPERNLAASKPTIDNNASPQDLIDSGFEQIESEVKDELLTRLKVVDPYAFEKIYIQAKRYNENKVRENDIRNFIGAMSGDTRKGIFVTTSSFDEKAKNKARNAHHTIILLDGSKLVDLMHKYNVGVQTKNVYEVKVVDNDFFDSEEI